MKIVESSVSEMQKAPTSRRRRSPETQQLVDAIAGLKPGQVKALVPEREETIKKLRPRISYAAKLAGRNVKIVANTDKVMFTLRPGTRRGSSNRAGATARKRKVQAKAIELGRRRKRNISAGDIIEALNTDGVDLGVSRPGTMIGAVLRSMPEFERTGSNEFRYIG